jgi:simple sugar transport system substrate-binding protein
MMASKSFIPISLEEKPLMKRTKLLLVSHVLVVAAMLLAACAPAATPTVNAPVATDTPQPKVVVGLILVGPKEDKGWNQSHWEGINAAIERNKNAELVWIDKVNPADRPGVTVEQIADDFANKGAKVIFTNSAEFKDGTTAAAKAHPEITFIHVSGDAVLDGSAPTNVGNFMGRMEYGKMMAGCAAALSTQTGSISYLGPLIDAETRRLVNSSYLGAKYCWETYRGNAAADLKFGVTWIGFWFNIPGVTLDPTQVVNGFFDGGSDVVISGIDTTEAVVVAGQRAGAGEKVWAIPYDFVGACQEAKTVCLGVPYFNWTPAYLKTISEVQAGTWKQSWDWNGPNWKDINNHENSAVGWVDGDALSAENKATLQTFIAGLADGSIDLYKGPLNYQDGSVFVAAGAKADDNTIWYTQQLLEGVTGASK